MKKHIMLGVNKKGNRCCQLSCLVPFDGLVVSELEASDFKHDCTNWNGCDEIQRTLEILRMKQTGKKITLDKPIVFYGSDYDWGHTYDWKFEVYEIHELTEI